MSKNNIFLTLPYAGCIWHWARMISAEKVYFSSSGLYQRRTFRTRTILLSSAGLLPISVPVHRDETLPYKDIKINYETDWTMQHLRALQACYGNSPFLEFLIDDFAHLYAKRHEYLWDLNEEMMAVIADILGVRIDYEITDTPPESNDLRMAIEPKFQYILRNGEQPKYYQVFSDKMPFAENLSIFDLIFNLGNEARVYLYDLSRQL